MIITPLPLNGAFRVLLEQHADERGFFARRFCADEFRRHGLETDFVQRSISFNRKAGTIRGLHFQAAPYLEAKLVRCTRGAAFDVMVDLRSGSSSFGQWYGVELSADNRAIVYIPKGFAHGFQTLVDETELDYEISQNHVPGAERGIRFDDPELNISWPLSTKIISDRDLQLAASYLEMAL